MRELSDAEDMAPQIQIMVVAFMLQPNGPLSGMTQRISHFLGTEPMKKLFALAAMLMATGSIAYAADLPQPPPQAPAVYVPVVAPVYNWGGIYVGINGGWGFGTSKWNVGPTTPFPAGLSSSVDDNGGVVGGTLGVNFQSGAFVFGAEGDFDYSGINTGTSSTACTISGSCQTGNNWLSTFRGRAGFAADRVLFYGTAGGVFGNMQTTFNGISSTKTQAGWTAGVGVEAAFAENWTAKIEYIYAGLGAGNVICATACVGSPTTIAVNMNDQLIRGGINYKFNF